MADQYNHRRQWILGLTVWGALAAQLGAQTIATLSPVPPAPAAGRAQEVIRRSDPPLVSFPTQLAQAGATTVWQTRLDLPFTGRIERYYLLDEYIYAYGSDGKVRCLRADTGRYVWTRQIAFMWSTIHPPVAYRASDADAVAFTRIFDVVVYDRVSGDQIEQIGFERPTIAPAVFSGDQVFTNSSDGRLFAHDVKTGDLVWRAMTHPDHRLGLLYRPENNNVIMADNDGMIAAIAAGEHYQRWAIELRAEPIGWLASDAENVYVSTVDSMLHAIDADSGFINWQYRLTGRPFGGPVVTATAVYQTLLEHGIHRIGAKSDRPSWFIPDAEQLLVEWPRAALFMMRDGVILLADRETGTPRTVLDPGEFVIGMTNTRNDAMFLGTPKGVVRCVRPVGARPLTAADFRPVATTRPATTQQGMDQEVEPAEAPEPGAEPARDAEPEVEPAGPLPTQEDILRDPLRSRRLGQ